MLTRTRGTQPLLKEPPSALLGRDALWAQLVDLPGAGHSYCQASPSCAPRHLLCESISVNSVI